MVEIVLPSAVPPNCAEANPITFPIEAIPVAPVSAMIFAIMASTSASPSCVGKNFSITAICANSGSAKSQPVLFRENFGAVLAGFYQFLK